MKLRTTAQPRPPEGVALSQQKADFTAEGSPPPGRVANAVPVRPAASKKPPTRKPHP